MQCSTISSIDVPGSFVINGECRRDTSYCLNCQRLHQAEQKGRAEAFMEADKLADEMGMECLDNGSKAGWSQMDDLGHKLRELAAAAKGQINSKLVCKELGSNSFASHEPPIGIIHEDQ
jgi:hypothetical protein